MKDKRIILIFITVMCACVTTPTFGDIHTVGSTSQVQFTSVTGGNVSIDGSWYSGVVSAGSYNLAVDGVSMQSFCIDLKDSVTSSTVTYKVTDLKDAADPTFGPMGTSKATALAELLYENWVPGMTNDQLRSLQVAVWEVTADGPGSLDLTSGSFMCSNAGASAYLATINGGYAPTSLFVGLSSPYTTGVTAYQDFVVKAPVPAAVLLGILGLGVAGWKLRKFA